MKPYSKILFLLLILIGSAQHLTGQEVIQGNNDPTPKKKKAAYELQQDWHSFQQKAAELGPTASLAERRQLEQEYNNLIDRIDEQFHSGPQVRDSSTATGSATISRNDQSQATNIQ